MLNLLFFSKSDSPFFVIGIAVKSTVQLNGSRTADIILTLPDFVEEQLDLKVIDNNIKVTNTGILECKTVIELLHVPISILMIELSMYEDDDRMSCISIVSAYRTLS